MFVLGLTMLGGLKLRYIDFAFSALMLFWCGSILIMKVGRFRRRDGTLERMPLSFFVVFAICQLVFWSLTSWGLARDYLSGATDWRVPDVVDLTLAFLVSSASVAYTLFGREEVVRANLGAL
ncbi:MAG: hypothetical protein KDB23_00050 [Planctomycetales bacterium]|nr:hypothetical protein [Planctomycetales bacterium]